MPHSTPNGSESLHGPEPHGPAIVTAGQDGHRRILHEPPFRYAWQAHAARDGADVTVVAGPQHAGLASSVREDARPTEVNHLLRLLARYAGAEYDALRPLLEPVALERAAVLYEAGGPVSHVYFPRTSVCSIVKIMADGRRVEVGTTGFEGMAGLPIVLGTASSPFQCSIQLPGSAWRLSAAALRDAATHGTVLHRILLRYAQYLYDQAAHSVACNRLHPVDERCARWLLMAHDRVGQAASFPLTQEFLAIMLGVRRASVSVAAETLQRDGRIRYRRGSITVVDRAGLEAAACECYHTDRADYDRLLGGGEPWGW